MAGRPRVYGSDAERKAASRMRARLLRGAELPRLPADDPKALVELVKAIPTVSETEEEYVARLVREAGTRDSERLERVRRYAVWRYRGYLAGVVASL